MARLSINTALRSVVIVGEYCGWDIDRATRGDLKKGNKLIHINDMPKGEYRILSCKSFDGGEIYPTTGKQMPNRYFNGEKNETIFSYFIKE